MKIIHCADIHLGSKINTKLNSEKSKERKVELLNTFQRMIDYAKTYEIKLIILSGDVFDSDKPYKKDKDMFYDIIQKNPDIDFLYLKGNHDKNENNYDLEFDNLKVFNGTWTSYEYDNVNITGIEIDENNFLTISNTLNLKEDEINIVMLHGQVSDSDGVDKINIKKLKDKNIDYLALGHIHKYSSNSLDSRGIYVYSGCLEGRGFDEIGEKGFVEIDINDKVSHKFIPFSERIIHERIIDIYNFEKLYDIIEYVIASVKDIDKKDILRIILKGEVSYEIENMDEAILKRIEDDFYYVEIKNNTTTKIDVSKFENDITIKGEFYRLTTNDSNLTEEEKNNILNLGLKLLEGREIE